mmetsp:Transcript_54155/g.115069  ORF Transcript_54155/g.115069 Transcript_54155/m.115069 type:complete len:201 (-) Transcript_54155:296-898(-)
MQISHERVQPQFFQSIFLSIDDPGTLVLQLRLQRLVFSVVHQRLPPLAGGHRANELHLLRIHGGDRRALPRQALVQLVVTIVVEQRLSRLVIGMEAIEVHQLLHDDVPRLAPVIVAKDGRHEIVLVDGVRGVPLVAQQVLQYDFLLPRQLVGRDRRQDRVQHLADVVPVRDGVAVGGRDLLVFGVDVGLGHGYHLLVVFE